jgi:hypothetical protein
MDVQPAAPAARPRIPGPAGRLQELQQRMSAASITSQDVGLDQDEHDAWDRGPGGPQPFDAGSASWQAAMRSLEAPEFDGGRLPLRRWPCPRPPAPPAPERVGRGWAGPCATRRDAARPLLRRPAEKHPLFQSNVGAIKARGSHKAPKVGGWAGWLDGGGRTRLAHWCLRLLPPRCRRPPSPRRSPAAGRHHHQPVQRRGWGRGSGSAGRRRRRPWPGPARSCLPSLLLRMRGTLPRSRARPR